MQQNSFFNWLVTLSASVTLLFLLMLAGFGTAQRAMGETLVTPFPTEPPVAVEIPTLTPLPTTPSPTATPTIVRPPTETPRPTLSPRPTRTRRPTRTPPPPTATSTRPPTSTPRPTPRPTPEATDHYWLARPIAESSRNWVETFYPYGTTGEGLYQVHHGVEFVNEMGTPVLAVAPGRVVVATNDASRLLGPPEWSLARDGAFYGNVVVVEHDLRYRDRPLYTLYGHMDSLSVSEGERVRAGQVLGVVGASGIALGPHLHLEVRVGRNDYLSTRNPQLWLVPFQGNGTIAGRVLDRRGRLVQGALVTLQPPGEDELFRYTTTYADDRVNGDDEWNENFVLGDVPAGRWRVAVEIGERTVVREVSVREGETSWLWIEEPVEPAPTSDDEEG